MCVQFFYFTPLKYLLVCIINYVRYVMLIAVPFAIMHYELQTLVCALKCK